MAKFFISYRRLDTGQLVGRMSEKLAGYFGRDAIYVDVDRVPVGQDFPSHIQKFISTSDALLVVIGPQWVSEFRNREDDEEDYVRIEIELALRQAVPILPILVDSAPMPRPDELPASISQLSFRNAFQLAAGREFNSDLGRLIQYLDSIRISKVLDNQQIGDFLLIRNCCDAVITFLRKQSESFLDFRDLGLWFVTYGTQDFYNPMSSGISLFLHRVVPDSSSLAEIHFILTAWGRQAAMQHTLVGWVIDRFQHNPVLPVDPDLPPFPPGLTLRVFPSTEDARGIWSSITDRPYEISLSYILRASY
jgi:hypothetical protein